MTDHTFDNNDFDGRSDNEEPLTDADILNSIDSELLDFDEKVTKLWEKCMVPYLQNENRDILQKIDQCSYSKFYEFMINNNKRIDSLLRIKRQIEKNARSAQKN